MKIRKGFVSNSSSSSFMGGIGIVKDMEKFKKWIEKIHNLGINEHDIRIVDPEEEANISYSELDSDSESWIVYMPINSEPSVSLNKTEAFKALNNIPEAQKAKNALLDNVSNIIIFSIGNDEGDGQFQMIDDWEVDYDIDLDFFPKEQQRLYKEFGSKESGIVCADKIFGAGRNG